MRQARTHTGLEARLGYHFADSDLLTRALTHSSAVSPGRRVERSYQRLEFLGDRVLDLVVAEMLYRRFPRAPEGDLNRTLVAMVRAEACAAMARELGLSEEIIVGDSVRRDGGAENETILGDAAEAVIAAIYLDGGLGPAYSFLERMFGTELDLVTGDRPDAKTKLQEWAQGRGLEPPAYDVVEREGPQHAPVFTISVSVAGYAPVSASGPSKRLAEHKAAEAFLVREKIWKGPA